MGSAKYKDSQDKKVENLDRCFGTLWSYTKRQPERSCEAFERDRAALENKLYHQELLNGPLIGIFQYDNQLLKYLMPPQPQPSAGLAVRCW